MKPDKRPEFHGTYAPADLHAYLYDDKITTTEFVLLQIIDSLVKCEGKGCFASSGTLAARVKVSRCHLQRMLQRLKKIGLLIDVTAQTNGEHERVLETVWSRIRVTIQKDSCDVNATGGVMLMQHPCDVNATHRNTKISNTKESSRPSPSGDSDSTLFFDSKTESIGNTPSNFHSTLAEQIYSKVEKRIPRRIKISMWVSELVKLEQFIIKSSKVPSKKAQRIMKEEISFHLLHLDSERQPQAYSPKSMLERWPQITIANRIRRDQEGIETEHAMSFEDDNAPKETKWTTRIISDEEWNKMQKESSK